MTARRKPHSKSHGWAVPFEWEPHELEVIDRACPAVPAEDLAKLKRDLARIVTTWRPILAERRDQASWRARNRGAARVATAAHRLQAAIDAMPQADRDVLDDNYTISMQESFNAPHGLDELARRLRVLGDAAKQAQHVAPGGAPHKDHVSEIVRRIAAAYESRTGRKPSSARTSRFHRVVGLCLVALGERGPNADLRRMISIALRS